MSEPLVFVHAADLHLGAPFQRVDAADPRVRDACVEATYEAFERIVGVCLEREAAFLIISGDAFDSAERPFKAQARFRSALRRLADAGIRVFLSGGNHDPVGQVADQLGMPDCVHVFSSHTVERVAYPDDSAPTCVLYGRSFGRAHETENLARGFHRAEGDPFSIGVLHANVGGNQDHGPYAPCSLEDLRSTRMDYWALGHIHRGQELSGDPRIVYPGSPQGLHPNEAGEHGCVVVTVGSAGSIDVERVETGRIVWDRREVEVGSAVGLDDVLEGIGRACGSARESAEGRPVIVRLELVGRSEAHAALVRPGALEDILEDVRAEQMDASPWVWVDRITDSSRPTFDLGRILEGTDFAGDLARIADEMSADEVVSIVAELAAPVEASVRGLDIRIDAASALERARDLALDRLLEDGEAR